MRLNQITVTVKLKVNAEVEDPESTIRRIHDLVCGSVEKDSDIEIILESKAYASYMAPYVGGADNPTEPESV